MHLELQKPWSEVKELLKEHAAHLTDDDLYFEVGKENALLERLSKKMNRSNQEIKAWIESMSAND